MRPGDRRLPERVSSFDATRHRAITTPASNNTSTISDGDTHRSNLSSSSSVHAGSISGKDRQFNRTMYQRIRLSRVDAGEPTGRWSGCASPWGVLSRVARVARARAMRGGVVGSPRWARMSRIVDASAMKAMMMHIAPAEVGRRTRIQPVATNRARMHVENERPLPRRRTSALRKIDGLQRVVRARSRIAQR